ncbi:MAG TPA: class I SAM-dependent methyltransferase [Terriglobales bacterium]|nr:class I SAM-dependent methyltransferase [Terriglobales bacterium]
MPSPQTTSALKNDVREFWNAEPCGTRYLEDSETFDSHAKARYELEPYIHEFAQFGSARGLSVLEIGVGMGADYLEWLKAGAHATGVDISSKSLERAKRRSELAGYKPDLRTGDAEHLPFADDQFDVVYSYGVMHHSPDTPLCVREAFRVLKPGGQLRIMLYHHRSLTGVMLWLRYGMLRGKSLRQTVYEFLESPGTKTYSQSEVSSMLSEFKDISMRQVFSPGDLLLNRPSARFQSIICRIAWKLYPRALVQKYCVKWGLFLLIKATKPAKATLALLQN